MLKVKISSIGEFKYPIFFANSSDECKTNLDPNRPIKRETSPDVIVLGVECIIS